MEVLSDISVLFVGPDREPADASADRLEDEGFPLTVSVATSVDEALDRLDDDRVDCIVSAYELPGQNGVEFLESVRERAPDLPFILLTADGSEAIASDAIAAGVTDYMSKGRSNTPYSDIATRIQAAVEQYRAVHTFDGQHAVIETARDGISILDEDGEFIYVDQSYADLYGYDIDDMIGEHWELVYPSDNAATARTEIMSTVKEAGFWSGETTGLRADGSTFSEGHRVAQIQSGELLCSVRNRSELERRGDEFDRLWTLVETLDDPVYVLDEKGQFEYVNDALSEMTGYDIETILGSTPALIKSETAIAQGEENLGRLLSDDGPDSVKFEIEIQPRHGEPIPCEDHMGVLPYEGESFVGSAGILRDISERKAREQNLKERNQRLNEFASVVSHDLRNPLNVAIGGIDIARTERDSEHLERAERALDRMEILIGDLLALARGDETEREFEPVSLAQQANEWWTNLETADATLVIDVDSTIYADAERLNQVGENLVRNAIEHGGDDVTVTIGDLPGGFYIEDDGPGIPGDAADNVFTAGYTTSDGGTGFGLSIVAQVIKNFGWEIRVADSATGGARFEITGVDYAE